MSGGGKCEENDKEVGSPGVNVVAVLQILDISGAGVDTSADGVGEGTYSSR